MKDDYMYFIDLSLLQCTKKDYGDKSKVKAHNQALKKLFKLKEKMKKNIDSNKMQLLLNHKDEIVVVNAAVFCLEIGVCKEKALEKLKIIIESSVDTMIVFTAKKILSLYSK